jgi:hypothetical protein
MMLTTYLASYLLTHLATHPLTHLPIHSPIYLPIHPPPYLPNNLQLAYYLPCSLIVIWNKCEIKKSDKNWTHFDGT